MPAASPPSRRFPGGPLGGVAAMVLLAALLTVFAVRCAQRSPSGPEAAALPLPTPAAAVPQAQPPPPVHFGFPTPQTRLLETNSAEVYMPTASGHLESSQHGSVRTAQIGSACLPSFHEGIDIAPTSRDRHGRPLDDVRAAAAGTVAHLSKQPGNSNYGRYIVLLHPDPVGTIYTLYAHLAEVDAGLRVGAPIAEGARLGRMGNTPESIIPVARSHTHFELGVICNPHFDRWFHAKKLTPDHGLYNGMNLFAVQPLAPYRAQAGGRAFTMKEFLQSLPPTFEIVLSTTRPLGFFSLYPELWEGAASRGAAVVLAVSETGIPLRGRAATPEETARLKGRVRACVLRVDEAALGRNGKRLVVRDAGAWRLGKNGENWLELLTFE